MQITNYIIIRIKINQINSYSIQNFFVSREWKLIFKEKNAPHYKF